MIQVTPVILCGGSGTRLWPLSRSGFPKQFLCLSGQDSLFQDAAKRLASLGSSTFQIHAPIIVTGEDHRFLAAEQLRETSIEMGAALLEPVGRNTAPALTLAALSAVENGSDPVLVVTPADQTVTDATSYTAAVQVAIADAAQGHIVVLGVAPNKPETGYGYIQAGVSCDARIDMSVLTHKVRRFVEKPDKATAQKYLEDGNYFWNAGMFVLRASVWLAAIENFRPDIAISTRAAWAAKRQDGLFIRPDRVLFGAVPSESVDYAVMEKCPGSSQKIHMVPLDAGWSDLGAWDAVWDMHPKDEKGNAHTGDVLLTDSRNTLVHSSSRLVALVGVDNLVVVETLDAILVADKSRTQDVRHIVDSLIANRRQEQALHRKVDRPWGWYDSVDAGDRFKVKRIQVKPGASLSLQKHEHRAEHWVVVKGLAEVTNGEKTWLLSEDQSTYIPKSTVHRLSNPGLVPLEIIEVQTGSYLGEDDIVRYQDDYGRTA